MEVRSGRGLAGNTIINLIGQIIPMLAALVSIPRLIAQLGTDRFGILTLAWMVIGYFSLFDLGLGRALTQMVAERLGKEDVEDLPGITWTALAVMLAMGLCGAAVAALLSPWLVLHVFKIPQTLQHEAVIAFYLLAASIPVVIVSAGLTGILTAYHRFGQINAVRIPLGISNYLLPLAIMPFSTSLVFLVLLLILTRLIAGLVQLELCMRAMPRLRGQRRILVQSIRPLFKFGGWMTLTNIIGPVMMYMDRFFIGALVSVAAVAYYATPYEMVTKLFVIPAALTSVLFPAFARAYGNQQGNFLEMLDSGWKYLLLAIFPPVLLIAAFAHEGLGLWLTADFADHSARIMQWLAAGVFINSFGQIVFALLQGAGRPDLTAKLHMVELLIYLPLLWWSLSHFGSIGAAVVWTLRVSFDTLMLMVLVARMFPATVRILRISAVALLLSALCLAAAAYAPTLAERAVLVALCAVLFPLVAWECGLVPEPAKVRVRQLFTRAAVRTGS
jgi:O-antigen/teichoic acid export membrane protein